MREGVLGQARLDGDRQIETLPEIDHHQPEGAGACQLVGGPGTVDAPVGHIGRDWRSA